MQHVVDALNAPKHYRMYVGGRWTDGSARTTIPVENPATGEIFATVPDGTEADALEAATVARKAQAAWAKLPSVERARLILKLCDEIGRERDRLAHLLVQEQGKPLNQAHGEVGGAIAILSYAAEAARRMEGDIVPSDNANEDVWIRRQPYGVVAAFTAWNFPLALAARKMGPALVAGNTVVLKPHEATPLTTLVLAELCERAGFPAGVVNVVTGQGRVVGDALVRTSLTDLVTMTGSPRAGKEIYGAGAEQIKVLRLELGGKAPFIVMEDADIDAAVEAAVASRFANCGQICTCNERMYVHEAVMDRFLGGFVDRVKALRVGDPMTNPDVGPKVSGPELDKVEALVQEAVSAGAEVLTGGRRLTDGVFARGHWFAPTVLRTSDNQAAIMRKEIFGPVVPVMSVRSFDEAIACANDSVYGLSAYLYTRDMTRLMRAVNELEVGELYLNRPGGELLQGFHNGWKQSGLGGEDGKYGLDNYLRKKTVYLRWN